MRWRVALLGSLISLWSLLGGSVAVASPSRNYTKVVQKLIHLDRQYTITDVYMMPATAAVGDNVYFVVELSTDFEGEAEVDPIVVAQINGAPVQMYHQGGRLWTTDKRSFLTAGSLNFEAQFFLQNRHQSEAIRLQLLEVRQEIDALSRQIVRETDPARKAYLESQRADKQVFKTDLENSLDSLKRPVSTKVSTHQIGPAMPPVNSPVLTSCEPAYGDSAGNKVVVVHGQNLLNTTKLVIGGNEIPLQSLSVTASSITFTTPSLTEGLKNITIESIQGGSTVVANLQNAYFAIDNLSGGGSAFPVAFAGIPVSTPAETPIQLDGSSSYSPDGTPVTYLWSIVTKPDDAGTLDGVFNDSTIQKPVFSSAAPGTYVVSLVVSNGVNQSTPSLTVVTVGPKDPLTLLPSVINGAVDRNGVYIGTFKACNNLPQEMSYQIFGADQIVFISGGKKGRIAKKSCQTFDFSVENHSAYTLGFKIPFVVQTPSNHKKILQIEVAPTTALGVSLLTKFPVEQWSGERDLEVLSAKSYVPIFGAFDEISATSIVVKNTTSSPITITNAPVLTHFGSTTVFGVDFPVGGLVVPANGEYLLDIFVDPAGFVSGDWAEALLEWQIESSGAPRTLLLRTNKLPAPMATSVPIGFGQHEESALLPSQILRVPFDFLGYLNGFTEVEDVDVMNDVSGHFFLDLVGWPGSVLVGNVDYVRSEGADIKSTFDGLAVGTYQARVLVKVRGYLMPFEYLCNIEIVGDTP
ncbi:IPT/TIG domain-containing protein [Bdellovibrio bacteriovorus]|nr:IPT/TIG domain-containing protein [Bdellovibrio bacteriovorus]